MKIIKGIIITLVILVVIVTVVGFLCPKHVRVERSNVMNAPAEVIHAQINDLSKWGNWDPWHKKDPNIKIEYGSSQVGAGAGYKWQSDNKEVGNGDLTILSSSPDSIVIALNFMDHGTGIGKFSFAKSDSGTKVIWSMETDMGNFPPARIFGLFMDKMMGSEFENGLADLKTIAEAAPTGPKLYRSFEVMEKDAPEMVYIGKKDSLGWDKISEFYQKNLQTIFEAIGKAKLEPSASPSGLFFKWDTVNHSTVMAAAIPVKGDANTKVKGYQTFVVSAGKMLHIAYYGGYFGTGTAHMAMDDYINEKGFMKLMPIMEEYVTDPGKESDSTKWLTNVYYPVK